MGTILKIKNTLVRQNRIYYLLYFLELIFASCFINYGNADFVLKYWGASGMASGMKLYEDLNIIVPPVSYILIAIPTMIFRTPITIVVANIVVMMLIFILVHKIADKYVSNTVIVFFINSVFLIRIIQNGVLYYDYNTLSFVFVLAAFYILQSRPFDYKNAFWIAVLCTFTGWTKHTVGFVFFLVIAVFLLVYEKKNIPFLKKICLMLATGATISLVFIICLVETGTMEDFVDLALIGATKFGGNSLFAPSIHILFVAGMFIVVVVKYVKSKGKDRDVALVFFFSLGSFVYMYPITDFIHMIEACIILSIALYQLIAKRDKNKINSCVEAGVCVAVVCIVMCVAWHSASEVRSDNSVFKGFCSSEGVENTIKSLKEETDKLDKEYYIIDKYAQTYSLALGRNQGYYDFLWNGNTGSKPPVEYVKELFKKDCYIIAEPTAERHQWDSNINKCIEENCTVYKKLEKFTVYETEKSDK